VPTDPAVERKLLFERRERMPRLTREGLNLLLKSYGENYHTCLKRVDTEALHRLIEIEKYIWELIERKEG
jgi:hypothetical protein